MRSFTPWLVTLLGVPCIPILAEDLQDGGSRLSYTLKIDPEERQVHVTGTVAGHSRKQLTKYASFGLRKQVKIGLKAEGEMVNFSYRVPIEQATFDDPFQPVLNTGQFVGFMSTVLLAPTIEGVEFKDIPLNIEAPEGWKIATSRGAGKTRYTLAGIKDLTGTLVCAGDYATHTFDAPHKDGKASTKCHVAIHGERDWNDERLMPYRRGMIAAWVFDIELRRATGGRNGLTDVLLRLIEEQPAGGLVQRKHFVAMLKEVSGKDMEALYRHLVEDEGAVDLAKHLGGTGFRITVESRAIEIDPATDAENRLFKAILSE